jgi:hypothetical protein
MWRRHVLILAAAAIVAVSPLCADGPAAAETVDLQLVFAIDVSASVNDVEYDLQRAGTAAALRDPAVRGAVSALPDGMAVAVVQWSSEYHQDVGLPWMRVTNHDSLDRFADAVAAMPRKLHGGNTMIHAGLAYAARMFTGSGFEPRRRVIDLSGNGIADKIPETHQIRDRLVADGIIINGLAIEELKEDLTAFFRHNVIGGPGAFVETAWEFHDVTEAMRRKLLREIDAGPVAWQNDQAR